MPFDLTDADTKAAFDAAVSEAISKSGLAEKNRELLSELKEARKGRQIDPSEIDKLESKIEELNSKLSLSEKSAKEAAKAAETATKALEAETGVTHKLLAENGVVAALTAAGVSDPAYLEAAKAMHLPAIKVVANGDERTAMYGEKSLTDAIKEWADGDIGKKFVSAPNNSGGGAQGGNTAPAGKAITQEQFNAMRPKERASFFDGGGVLQDA